MTNKIGDLDSYLEKPNTYEGNMRRLAHKDQDVPYRELLQHESASDRPAVADIIDSTLITSVRSAERETTVTTVQSPQHTAVIISYQSIKSNSTETPNAFHTLDLKVTKNATSNIELHILQYTTQLGQDMEQHLGAQIHIKPSKTSDPEQTTKHTCRQRSRSRSPKLHQDRNLNAETMLDLFQKAQRDQ